jgi:hypothetical protein
MFTGINPQEVDMKCPEREAARLLLNRLERSGLTNTMVYRMVAKEFDRDLYTANSRLHLALPKAEPLLTLLVEAGRSRPKRRIAKDIIRTARVKVR